MIQNKPILLSQEEMNSPEQVLKDFYLTYPISRVRTLVKLLLSGTTSRLDAEEEKEQIQKFKALQEQLLRVLEAGWIIDKKMRRLKA